MIKEWRTRDWKWLIGILVGIIVLILAGWIMKIPDVGTYLSILGTGVSIALALIAIYISLSQNNNSEILNVNTTNLLARIDEKVGNVNEKVTSINPKEIATLVQTNVNATLDDFSDTLFSKLEKSGVDQGIVEKLKQEVAVQLAGNSTLAESFDVTSQKEFIEDQVKKVLGIIKDKSFSESVGIINSTSLTDQARQQLYKSLVYGKNKKPRDDNDDMYNALREMYVHRV
ncbi:hypothetical protein [Desulfosporosinus sp. FKB]|uniref:hypothetical protein n=1 Tax=Desulfosporosinus sp. FKB TaxID=1969835 RepID=UPI000B4A175E|nr:hypothetical protein [Desulfosporosinus sp. FKB]